MESAAIFLLLIIYQFSLTDCVNICFFLQVMESQADKSTSNTPTTPLGSSQGIKDSNELPPSNSVTECETNPGDTLDDGEKPGGKRKRSVVWNHFKQLIVNGQEKTKCNYCQKRLGGSSKNGTKHLLDHFQRCPR